MNLVNIENELNRMKAETLGDAGRRLEALSAMIKREICYQQRSEKILTRLSAVPEGLIKWGRHAKLLRVREKLKKKIAKSFSALRNMQKHREELYKNLIMQREALGMTDHEWIDKFYMK